MQRKRNNFICVQECQNDTTNLLLTNTGTITANGSNPLVLSSSTVLSHVTNTGVLGGTLTNTIPASFRPPAPDHFPRPARPIAAPAATPMVGQA